ncbi:hypothetical protein BN1326_120014 [Staphylococcus argenteus]|uniref:Uncharacterized protein n=1 Tax=Staphylococcus argenteus TaxID=985002 RepID=A0A7U7JQN5_9STAP|nr:hypothetical protein BN1326_120014 [Staphylococcus argenteus]CRI12735.1 hypothetical protein BN1326_120014 [Staphylococcus argenteus]
MSDYYNKLKYLESRFLYKSKIRQMKITFSISPIYYISQNTIV